VKYSDGKFTVLDGPFSEAKELVGGWALMEVRDKDEAIEWTKRFLTIAGPGDQLLISRGLTALAKAESLGGERGPDVLQAAIAACHARAFRAKET